MSTTDARGSIHERIRTIASKLGNDASGLADDDLIPATGLLDSAGIYELMLWYEDHFGLAIAQSDINVDNFGSVDAMVDYLDRHRRA